MKERMQVAVIYGSLLLVLFVSSATRSHADPTGHRDVIVDEDWLAFPEAEDPMLLAALDVLEQLRATDAPAA